MMSNGSSTVAISANIPASGSSTVWSQSYPGANVMETIPEEQEVHSPLRHVDTVFWDCCLIFPIVSDHFAYFTHRSSPKTGGLHKWTSWHTSEVSYFIELPPHFLIRESNWPQLFSLLRLEQKRVNWVERNLIAKVQILLFAIFFIVFCAAVF